MRNYLLTLGLLLFAGGLNGSSACVGLLQVAVFDPYGAGPFPVTRITLRDSARPLPFNLISFHGYEAEAPAGTYSVEADASPLGAGGVTTIRCGQSALLVLSTHEIVADASKPPSKVSGVVRGRLASDVTWIKIIGVFTDTQLAVQVHSSQFKVLPIRDGAYVVLFMQKGTVLATQVLQLKGMRSLFILDMDKGEAFSEPSLLE